MRDNNMIAGIQVHVYTQERRTATALYDRGLPALTEFTIHMWHYGVPDDDNRSGDWYISLAVPGGYPKGQLLCSAVMGRVWPFWPH